MNEYQLDWPVGQLLVSAQGGDAEVMQRVLDIDTKSLMYRIQFAPYDKPAQMYYPNVAYACFYKREQ